MSPDSRLINKEGSLWFLYKTRSDFSKGSRGAYHAAYKSGWLDEICIHMSIINRPLDSWTKEECLLLSSQYNKRSDFNKNHRGAYKAAQKNGWLDEICAHTTKKVKNFWNDKGNCIQEAKKHSTITGFRINNRSAYGAAKRNGWLDEICKHMPKRAKRKAKAQ